MLLFARQIIAIWAAYWPRMGCPVAHVGPAWGAQRAPYGFVTRPHAGTTRASLGKKQNDKKQKKMLFAVCYYDNVFRGYKV